MSYVVMQLVQASKSQGRQLYFINPFPMFCLQMLHLKYWCGVSSPCKRWFMGHLSAGFSISLAEPTLADRLEIELMVEELMKLSLFSIID